MDDGSWNVLERNEKVRQQTLPECVVFQDSPECQVGIRLKSDSGPENRVIVNFFGIDSPEEILMG